MKSKHELQEEIKDLQNLIENPDVPAAAKKDAERHIEGIKAEIIKLEEKPAATQGATSKKEKKSHKNKPAEGEKKKERKSHKAKPSEKKTEHKKGAKKSHKHKEAPEKSQHKAKPVEAHKPEPVKPATPAKKKLKKKFERKAYKPKHAHIAHHEPNVFHKIAEAEKLLAEIPREIRALEHTAREKAIHEFREKLEKSGIVLTKKFEHGGRAPGSENFFDVLFGIKKKEFKGGGGIGRGGENLHPHVRLPKGNRLAHGYETAKNAPVHKADNFSTPTVKVDTGHRLVKGYELEKGKKGKQYKGGGGLSKKVTPSKELAAIVGSEPISRSEITSKIWKHIKEKGLQDPANKRNINADKTLRPFFGKDQITMFELNKIVSKHIS